MSDSLKVFGVTYTDVAGFKAKTPTSTTLTYVRPDGTLNITESGTIDVAQYANVSVPAGSATTPSTALTANPTISVNTSTGEISASYSTSTSVTPTVSAGFVTAGTAGTVSASGSSTSQLSTQAAATITPTESSQTAVAANKYTLGAVTVDAISSTYVGSGIDRNDSTDLSASGATVTAPAGYYANSASKSVASGSAATPATTITANPSISVNTSTGLITSTASATQSVTPTVSAGYVSSGTSGTITVSGSNTEQLSVQAAATITPTESSQTAVAANKYTTGAVTVGAISSSYVGSGITRRDSTDMSLSGGYAIAPAGYYAENAQIAAGSAPTPGAPWVSLWDGSWNSGDITVDGLSDYGLFKIRVKNTSSGTEQGTCILAVFGGEANGYLRGEGGYPSSSSADSDYYFNATVSGDVLTFVDCHSRTSSGTNAAMTVIEIIGII